MINLIGNILLIFIELYIMLLIVRVFISWVSLPKSRWIDYICKYTDPAINYISRKFPFKFGFLNLSIIILFTLLAIAHKIIADLIVKGKAISIYYLFELLLTIASKAFSIAVFLYIIAAIAMIIIRKTPSIQSNSFLNTLQTLLNPVLTFLRRNLKIRNKDPEITYLIIIIVSLIILGLIGNEIFDFIIGYVDRIQQNRIIEIIPLENEF